jgi:uroporphyrinogen-III synthase
MSSDHRIIVTREREQGRPWVDELTRRGHAVLELPLLRFRQLPAAEGLADQVFDWILLTSPQGVRAFFAAGLQTRGARLGALGEGTAQALAQAGASDDLGIRARDGRELATAFVSIAELGSRVLLPSPRKRGPEVEQILAAAGFQVTAAALYETLPVPPAELPDVAFADRDRVFFCSPSTVRAFCGKWDARPRAVAIGETTAALTRQMGFATTVAETPDLDAMIRAAGLDPIASPNPTGEPK